MVKDGRTSKDLVSGIMQLADATGLSARLPRDLQATLSALFAYRNKMFHLGFEWPLDERLNFAKRITNEAWPNDWFAKATSDGKPWVFYLSKVFIEHCLATIEKVLDAFSVLVRDELLPKHQ